MRFQDEQMREAMRLELEGNAVISCVYGIKKELSENDIAMLEKMHKKKIDLCDAIFVVNVDGYVGNATKNEIEYAKQLGKEVIWLETPKEYKE